MVKPADRWADIRKAEAEAEPLPASIQVCGAFHIGTCSFQYRKDAVFYITARNTIPAMLADLDAAAQREADAERRGWERAIEAANEALKFYSCTCGHTIRALSYPGPEVKK